MAHFPLLLDHTTLLVLPNKTRVGIAFTDVSEEICQLRANCFVTLITGYDMEQE
jgi:hypothetical protein